MPEHMTEQNYIILKQRILSEFSETLDRILRPEFNLDVVETDDDRIRRFICECCTLSVSSKVGSTALYTSYEQWATNNNLPVITHKSFSSALKNMRYNGIVHKTGRNGAFFQGIMLRNQ